MRTTPIFMNLLSQVAGRVSDKSLFVGAVSAFSVKVISAGSAFLLNLVIARHLGASQAGYFFLAQAIAIFLANISRQGFDNAMVRYIAGYRVAGEHQHISHLFLYAFKRVVALSLLIAICVFATSSEVSQWVFSKVALTPTLSVAAWLIVPLALSQLVGFCFQGKKKVALAMTYQSAFLGMVAVTALWFLAPTQAVDAMQIYTVCALAVCLVGLLQWGIQLEVRPGSIYPEEKQAVNQSIKPLFIILLLSQVTQWAGQLLIGMWASAVDVALFATALRTAMLTSFILIAVNAIAAPRFAEAFREQRMEDIRAVALSSGRLMTLFALPVIIFMWVFAPWIMGLFGAEFVQAANVLRILSFGQFINVITGSVGYLLQMTGNEVLLRNNMFISSAILVVGSAILIPLAGIIGAAIVTAVSIATQNLLCVYQVKKKLGFNTLAIWR
jgi:O-antigen/teichoic acid export membrane protein